MNYFLNDKKQNSTPNLSAVGTAGEFPVLIGEPAGDPSTSEGLGKLKKEGNRLKLAHKMFLVLVETLSIPALCKNVHRKRCG